MSFSLTISAKQASAGLIRDTELEHGFSELVKDMAAKAGFPDGVEIRLVMDNRYNAFVAGGKTIYVHSGLLLEARSAEEILGVIAHEIGHLAAGHVPLRSEDIKNAGVANALTAIAAAVAATGSSDAALGVLIGGTDRTKRHYLSASRNDEAVADGWAVKLLDHAGISSSGLANLMRRMASQRALPETRQASYYRSHPGANERVALFEDHLSTSPVRGALLPLEVEMKMLRLVTKTRAFAIDPLIILQKPVKQSWAGTQGREKLAGYARAIAYYRRGDLERAQKEINTVIDTYPNDTYFHEFAGDIALSAGDIDASVIAYQNALKIAPSSPQISVSLGRTLIAGGTNEQLSLAITVLEQASAAEPDWAFAKRQLAIAYGRSGIFGIADMLLAEEAVLLGKTEQALRLARRALTQSNLPQNAQARAQDIIFQVENGIR
ncbi:MAG: M48 family metalloprotease [Alphaproteobacteria bacterium]